jgi:Na+/H+-dicarboxylate symporter
LILIPIIENHLGFDAEMSAFLTAIYILFDPILTTGNVLGNGALAIILTRIMQFFSSDKDPILPVPKEVEGSVEEEVQPDSA